MTNQVIIYFSGTGNTKALAERLGEDLSIGVYSIEEDMDWDDLLAGFARIIIMYPVHYSVPPMLMRDFLARHYEAFENKEIISIVSQMIASGDGARVLEDFLPESSRLIDCHYVDMPNNIVNIPFMPVTSDRGNRRKTRRGMRKIDRISEKISQGKFKRRGDCLLGLKLGQSQRIGGLESEEEKRKQVWVSDSCIACGLCQRICPSHNFIVHEKALPQGKCSLCMRCENKCPVNAISVLLNRPVKKKYPGPRLD